MRSSWWVLLHYDCCPEKVGEGSEMDTHTRKWPDEDWSYAAANQGITKTERKAWNRPCLTTSKQVRPCCHSNLRLPVSRTARAPVSVISVAQETNTASCRKMDF